MDIGRPIMSLAISEKQLMRLKKREIVKVSHQMTARWRSVYHNQPKMIRFYTIIKMYSAIFIVKSIEKTESLNESIIQITVGKFVM